MLAQIISSASIPSQWAYWPKIHRAILSSALAAIGCVACLGQADRQAPSLPKVQVLAGHHPQWANPENDESPLPSDQKLPPLTLVLTRSATSEAEFDRFLAEQQDPASPHYHHWLTPAEVGERFGRSAQELAGVTAWLDSHHLRVDWVSPSRVFVGFSGSAGDVGNAFHAELHAYSMNGVERFAVSAEPSVPAEVAPLIQAVRGLYQVDEQPMHHSRTLTSVSPEFTDGASHFLTPQDFATIYDMGSSQPATGQTIGIVGESRTNPADLANFVSLTGTNLVAPTEIVPTAFGGVDPGPAYTAPPAAGVSIEAQTEATLDVLRAGSTAQGATPLLVVATGSSGGIGADAQYLVQTSPLPANVMSISFGVCESSVGDSEVNYWDALYKQAAAEGISVFVASGDAGASGCDTPFETPPAKPAANSPNALCSSSYATCVGGTELNDASDPTLFWGSSNGSGLGSALSYIPEGGWNEPLNQNAQIQAAASGGGVSKFIATPVWQTGTGVPSARSGRYTPDLAFSASEHDAYFACLAAAGGSCTSTGGVLSFTALSGTSATAPSMAGIAVLLNAARGEAQGTLNPELYNLALSVPAAFHDITVTSSGVIGCSVKTPSMCNNSAPGPTALTGGQSGYLVTMGYDEVTGLGSLDVQQFLSNFAGNRATPTVTIATSPNITTAQPENVSVQVVGNGSNPPTGSVVLTSGSYTSAPVLLSDGSSSFVIPAATLPVGLDTLDAAYTPDTASAANYNAASNSTPITVTKAPIVTPTIAVTPSLTQAFTAQSFTVTASVAGASGDATPTGSVTLSSGSWKSAPAVLSDGQVMITVPAQTLPAGSDTLTATYTPDTASTPIYASATGTASVTITTTPLITPSISAQVPTTSITTAQAFSVTVGVSAPGSPTPTGAVTISSGSYTSAATTLSNGSASLNIAAGSLPVGADTLNVNYAPDAVSASIYTGASGTATVTISAPPPPSFTISGTAASVTAGSATGNTSTITIAPSGGFTGSIELTAKIVSSPAGAQDPPTLSFGSTNPVVIAGSGSGTAVLTITTTAPTTAALAHPMSGSSRVLAAGSGVLSCLVLVFLRSKRRRALDLLGMLLLGIAAVCGMMACGSGGATTTGTGNPGTTAGAYTVSITGTSGSATAVGSIALTVH